MNISPCNNAEIIFKLRNESFPRNQSNGWTLKNIGITLLSNNTECYIYKDRGIPVGFILTMNILKEAEILSIGVTATYKRRGIGQNLINFISKKLNESNFHYIFLEVAEDNNSAISFYKKNGFTAFGRRKKYYKRENKKIDAIMMKKELYLEPKNL